MMTRSPAKPLKSAEVVKSPRRVVRRYGLWGATLGSALALTAACGGGNDVKCGPGTKLKGEQCVLDDTGSNLGGAGGMGGAPSAVGDLDFDGVKAVAPAAKDRLFVAWDASDEEGVTYEIFLSKKEDGFNFSSPQSTAPEGASSIQVAGLDEDTEYFVIVRAKKAGFEDDNSVVKSAKTQDDDTAPQFAGATDAEPAGAAAVEITWDSPASDKLTPDEAIVYVVYMGTQLGEVDLDVPVAFSTPGASSVVVENLPAPDTEYFFVVRAQDAAGNLDDNEIEVSSVSGPDTTPPVFAGCTNVAPLSAAELLVQWNHASDNTADETGLVYNLYASTTPNGHNFAEPNATSAPGAKSGVIPGLERDTEYFVVCRAEDPSGNEDENTVFRVGTTRADDEPPTAVMGVTLVTVEPKAFELSWTASTDTQTDQEELVYDVYLSETSGGHGFDDVPPPAPQATSNAGETSVIVSDLETNTEYFVVVRARDKAGNSSTNTDETSVVTLVSFRDDIEIPIFGLRCAAESACHDSVAPTAGMNLTPGFAYSNIVDVDATTYAFKRIVPGDADNSHVYQRVTIADQDWMGGSPGFRMPTTGLYLSETQTDTIRLWIEQGALNN